MFHPTHMLVVRSHKTPVQLGTGSTGISILTEKEWQQGSQPAFEFRPKQGIFCRGVLVVGYKLEPIQVEQSLEQSLEQLSAHPSQPDQAIASSTPAYA
jgi:hypothetical protein